jgi:O-antigen ligase
LLMLLLGVLGVGRSSLAKSTKVLLVVLVLLLGLPGFFARYALFFQRGATSVSARFDYWRAAWQTFKANPVFGTGPGTFAIPYAKLKRPESEMSRLVHNDFLQQACDSGLPGFLAYGTFLVGVLSVTGRSLFKPPRSSASESITQQPSGQGSLKLAVAHQGSQKRSGEWEEFAMWLGVVGWASQSLFEFGLYIPALSWLAFTFIGLLLGRSQDPSWFDKG